MTTKGLGNSWYIKTTMSGIGVPVQTLCEEKADRRYVG